MALLDEIRSALFASDPADLPAIRSYVAWVAIRRQIHNRFYQQVHWVQKPARRAHWVSS